MAEIAAQSPERPKALGGKTLAVASFHLDCQRDRDSIRWFASVLDDEGDCVFAGLLWNSREQVLTPKTLRHELTVSLEDNEFTPALNPTYPNLKQSRSSLHSQLAKDVGMGDHFFALKPFCSYREGSKK